jgi:hypothetical protein
MDITRYIDAKKMQIPFYFTGKPCKRGHIAKRITCSKNCSACHHEDCRSTANKVQRARYVKKRRADDLNFKLAANLRSRLYRNIQVNRGGSAVRDLGCSIADLRKYIEEKFQPGMAWDNWSVTGWHLDHIKPLSSFNLSDPLEASAACHYTNLQPLWAADNIRKGGW